MTTSTSSKLHLRLRRRPVAPPYPTGYSSYWLEAWIDKPYYRSSLGALTKRGSMWHWDYGVPTSVWVACYSTRRQAIEAAIADILGHLKGQL